MRYEHGGDIYTYGQEKTLLDFSVNINPLGPSGAVLKAAGQGVLQMTHYPDSRCRKLRAATAKAYGVGEERIVFGNGAAELLFLLAFAKRPGRALVTAPAFSEYERALLAAGCIVEKIPLKRERQFDPGEDVLESLTEKIDMLFLCSPMNLRNCWNRFSRDVKNWGFLSCWTSVSVNFWKIRRQRGQTSIE